MAFEHSIVDFPFAKAVVIKSQTKMLGMPKRMSYTFPKVLDYIRTKDQPCPNGCFALYDNLDWEEIINRGLLGNLIDVFTKKWSFQAGWQVTDKVESSEDMEFVEYPYKKAATCKHLGPYQKVGDSYKQLYNWLKAEGHTPEAISMEMYLNDPKKVGMDKAETQIYIPLK